MRNFKTAKVDLSSLKENLSALLGRTNQRELLGCRLVLLSRRYWLGERLGRSRPPRRSSWRVGENGERSSWHSLQSRDSQELRL